MIKQKSKNRDKLSFLESKHDFYSSKYANHNKNRKNKKSKHKIKHTVFV